MIDLLDRNLLINLRFCSYWFENTPQGKFFLGMAFSQSKYYSDNLSVNVRRGLHEKAKEGVWPGFAPIGYLNNSKKARSWSIRIGGRSSGRSSSSTHAAR